MREYNLITADKPKSQTAEAYRVLRTNIKFAGVDKVIKQILFTSAEPREGKSSIVANLAVSMSQAGLRVLIIDADLRNPSQHKIFGLDNLTGLTTTLVGGGSGFSFVTSIPHEGVHVLTAGPMPPNPAELLESRRMKQILHEVTQAYDLVLIDSPPVIAVTDASVLAQSVDGVIIVLAAGEVERENAMQAKEQLNQVGAKILGIVVNKVKVKKDAYYYGEEMLQKTPGIKEHLEELGAKIFGITINKIKAKKHHRNKN